MQNHATLGPYVLIRTLGSGGTSKVKLGFDPKNKKYYAIKIIKPDHMSENKEGIEKEIKMLSSLQHPNIVNMIEVQENAEYQKKSGETYRVMAIVLELVSGGDLFEFVAHSGRFSETVSRTYFKILIETVQFCHEQGITHRDLKPENVLLDENFNIKLTDFGTATFLCGQNHDEKLFTQTGTDQYMAPEMHFGDGYSGAAIDVFACGVILFLLVSGHPPFVKADPRSDTYYKSFCKNKSKSFWNKHESTKAKEDDEDFYSPEFRDLIDGMLAPLAEDRLTIEQVKQHPWFNGPTISMEDLKKEFSCRKKKVDMELEKIRQIRKSSKENIITQVEGQVQDCDCEYQENEEKGTSNNLDNTRSLVEIELEQRIDSKVDLKQERIAREYKNSEDGYRPLTEMFCVATVKEAFLYVCLASQAVFNEFYAYDGEYKIKGKLLKDLGNCNMNILISKVDADTCCIEFHRNKGNSWIFSQAVKDLKEKITSLQLEYNVGLA